MGKLQIIAGFGTTTVVAAILQVLYREASGLQIIKKKFAQEICLACLGNGPMEKAVGA